MHIPSPTAAGVRIRGFVVAGAALAGLVLVAVLSSTAPVAQQPAVAVDADDLGGVVTGPKGPEAGVWVIAETTNLPTKFAKVVVTDERHVTVFCSVLRRHGGAGGNSERDNECDAGASHGTASRWLWLSALVLGGPVYQPLAARLRQTETRCSKVFGRICVTQRAPFVARRGSPP